MNTTPTAAGQVSTCTVATEWTALCFPCSYRRFPFSEQHFIRHFLSLLFLLRPHQQYQTEKEESKAAGAEILSTFTSSPRYHTETGNGETASASYLLGMVNYSSNCTQRMTPSSATCVQVAQHEAIPRTALCAGRAIPQRAAGPCAVLLQSGTHFFPETPRSAWIHLFPFPYFLPSGNETMTSKALIQSSSDTSAPPQPVPGNRQ